MSQQADIFFARRDASLLNSPGFAGRYHAQAAPDRWFAACRDGDETSRSCTVLDDFTCATADRVSELLICKRPACLTRWRQARATH